MKRIAAFLASLALAGAAYAGPGELTLPQTGLRAADIGGTGTGPFVMQAGNGQVVTQTATILSGASLSGSIDLGTTRLFAIIMPAAWTSASLTFQGSVDGTNWFNLYTDTGTEVSATVAASQYVVMSSPAQMLGVRYAKVRSGTSGSAVNQGADRALTLVAVP